MIDDGAVRVLRESGRSLLPVGVTGVEGRFARGEIVSCVDRDGQEVARGLVNYGADESRSIMGRPSGSIAERLGYAHEPEIIHRDNMVLVGTGMSRSQFGRSRGRARRRPREQECSGRDRARPARVGTRGLRRWRGSGRSAASCAGPPCSGE